MGSLFNVQSGAMGRIFGVLAEVRKRAYFTVHGDQYLFFIIRTFIKEGKKQKKKCRYGSTISMSSSGLSGVMGWELADALKYSKNINDQYK